MVLKASPCLVNAHLSPTSCVRKGEIDVHCGPEGKQV